MRLWRLDFRGAGGNLKLSVKVGRSVWRREFEMKTFTALVVTVAMFGVITGCANQGSTVKTKQGAVAGGLLGAAAGAVIGHQSGRALEGAAIGAAAGAAGGALMGSAADEQESRQQPAQ